MNISHTMPSVLPYTSPGPSGQRQWGASFGEDVVMATNTKLELDFTSWKVQLLGAISKLPDGTHNRILEIIVRSKVIEHPRRSPEYIVTEYLTHVFQHCIEMINFIGPRLRPHILADLVIPVPAVSSISFVLHSMANADSPCSNGPFSDEKACSEQ